MTHFVLVDHAPERPLVVAVFAADVGNGDATFIQGTSGAR